MSCVSTAAHVADQRHVHVAVLGDLRFFYVELDDFALGMEERWPAEAEPEVERRADHEHRVRVGERRPSRE